MVQYPGKHHWEIQYIENVLLSKPKMVLGFPLWKDDGKGDLQWKKGKHENPHSWGNLSMGMTRVCVWVVSSVVAKDPYTGGLTTNVYFLDF